MRGERVAALALLVSAAAGCNATFGPTTPDKNWTVIESAHFNLHARPGTFAEHSAPALGTVLDDQYETTLRLLGAQYSGRVDGFLYNNAADAGLEGEYSGTAYPDTRAFRATATPPLDDNLFALVQHEANHVIMVGAIGRAHTSMLNEGLASALISERYVGRGAHFYYTWTRAHKSQVIPIERLANDAEWPDLNQNLAYAFAASFLAYLLETEGLVKLRELYYADSGEFVSRFQQIYGRSLPDAQAAWLTFCGGA